MRMTPVKPYCVPIMNQPTNQPLISHHRTMYGHSLHVYTNPFHVGALGWLGRWMDDKEGFFLHHLSFFPLPMSR